MNLYQRYYDGYNLGEAPSLPSADKAEETPVSSVDNISEFPAVASIGNTNFLQTDDILLIGVLILLLHEECNDKALILIIGFLLLSGFINI